MRATVSVICLIVIVLGNNEVYGAASIQLFKSDAHPGKCVLDADTILDKGQTINRPICERVSCNSGGWVDFVSCGVRAVQEPCKLGGPKYPKADYPKCCIHVLHCPDGDVELHFIYTFFEYFCFLFSCFVAPMTNIIKFM